MSQRPSDPRQREPIGNTGLPAELIDTPENLPGDQPTTGSIPEPSLSSSDGPQWVDDLVRCAEDARHRSYAPYSKFRAGAAVLTDRGSIVTGAIVENVSLGLAMCAERVALFSTIAQGERPIGLALVAPTTAKRLTWPCGACLQTALELGGDEFVVAAAPVGDRMTSDTTVRGIRELLPVGPHRPDRGPQ